MDLMGALDWIVYELDGRYGMDGFMNCMSSYGLDGCYELDG